ncbi:MAG: DapH/DapD/GlmU-related protein [Deinococcales bacterium]
MKTIPQSITSQELFDIGRVDEALRDLLSPAAPWQILAKLDAFLSDLADERCEANIHPSAVIEGPIYMAKGVKIKAHAYIEGPAWLGEGAEIGHGAYLRGGVILGSKAKVGHSSEVKHALLLSGAQAPHFNYVGDSILGAKVNIGAGVKLANFHTFGQAIKVEQIPTGLRKFSAAIGDDVSIGCNAVLAPGTIIGRGTVVYNGAMLRGIYPAHSVVKLRSQLEVVEKLSEKGS